MANTRTVSIDELAEILGSISRPQPIGLVALTDTRALKTGNPFRDAQILKLSHIRPFIGVDYASSVNRARSKQGAESDFIASSAVYTHLRGPLVRFKSGSVAVAVQFNEGLGNLQVGRPIYLVRSDLGALTPVSRENVMPWLPKVKSPGAAQGLDHAVLWRTYSLTSLVSVHLNGEHLRVRHAQSVSAKI